MQHSVDGEISKVCHSYISKCSVNCDVMRQKKKEQQIGALKWLNIGGDVGLGVAVDRLEYASKVKEAD